MLERFTDRSRRVVMLAQEEARLLNHDYIGTEHLLLGLIHEGEGVAAKVLTGKCGIELEEARSAIEGEVGKGTNAPSGHIPFTPRNKKVLELAQREMYRLKQNYLNTEHLLLGLLCQEDATGGKLLLQLGANPEELRVEIYHLLRIDEHGTPKSGVSVSSMNLAQLNYYIKEYEATLVAMKARREQLEASGS